METTIDPQIQKFLDTPVAILTAPEHFEQFLQRTIDSLSPAVSVAATEDDTPEQGLEVFNVLSFLKNCFESLTEEIQKTRSLTGREQELVQTLDTLIGKLATRTATIVKAVRKFHAMDTRLASEQFRFM